MKERGNGLKENPKGHKVRDMKERLAKGVREGVRGGVRGTVPLTRRCQSEPSPLTPKPNLFHRMCKLPRWARLSIVGGALLLLLSVIVLPIVLLTGRGARPADAEAPPIATPDPTPDWRDTFIPACMDDEPEPTATPEPLKKHDKSEEVTRLQERLMSLGYLDLDEPTDYFGNATQYAVQLFQRQHDLDQDGVAGAQTQMLLFGDDAQPYVMKEGAVGRDVKALQEQLYDLGYLDKKDIDGAYGEKTIAAVKAFQKRNKLRDDGKTGEKTLDKLYSDDAKMSSSKLKEVQDMKRSDVKQEASSVRIEKMIEAAKSKLGSEYILGHKGPNTFDCSGLVYYCLRAAGSSGIRLNARGYANKNSWKRIDKIENVKKGDLLFFTTPGSRSVTHVGIYIGNGTMIDASSGNGKVVRRPVSAYWKKNFYCARRPFS